MKKILLRISLVTLLIAGFSPICQAHETSGEASVSAPKTTWTCPSCGHKGNTGKFCSNCGAAKPEPWTCPSCGRKGNTGKFCSNCGAKKPEVWTCPSCGRKDNTGKFCSNCGTPKPGGTQQKPADNGIALNVLRTDGAVYKYKLSDMPDVSFSGTKLRVGNVSYDLNNVQRFQYGTGASGVKSTSDYSGEKQRAIYIYRNDGCFNAFNQNEIKRIRHNIADTLTVDTRDSLYKIPLAAVDSIGLHSFKTIYNKKVVNLAPYETFIASASVEQNSIKFTSDLPEGMKPKTGDILYSETFTAKLPEGFAGRVVTTDGYSCTTEPVGIDDIYERVLFFGEYTPSRNGQKLALVKKSTEGKGSADCPAPDDLLTYSASQNFPLGTYSHTFKKGPVEATYEAQMGATVNVALVKLGLLESAAVHLGIDINFMMGVSMKASGSLEKSFDPTIPLMAPIPIPDCPIFSIGLDLQLFAQAQLSGEVSAGVEYYGGANISFDYRDGKSTLSKSLKNGSKLVKAKAEAKGELYLGLGVLPNIQLTGGMLKLGPAVYGGPKFVVSLPIDSDGKISCVYDILKPAKLELYAQATFTAKAIYINLKGERESKAFDGLNPDAFIKEWYFVPEFTKPDCQSPLLRSKVVASTKASRELLIPVEVGMRVKKGNSIVTSYIDPESYGGPQVRDITNSFSGFEYDTKYTVVPTIGLFGQHMEATPVSEFEIHPEVQTEDAINVTLNSATIAGRFPDISNNFKTYGLKYKIDGGEWIDFKNPKKDADAFFRVNLNNLKENTLYRFQAYLVENGKTYLGEEKTFLTKITEIEYRDPGSYRFEWQISNSRGSSSERKKFIREKGYYERKGSIYYRYTCDEENPDPLYERFDDRTHTYDVSDDLVHWDDGDGGGPHTEYSRDCYNDVMDGRKQYLKQAKEIGFHAFYDSFGHMGMFSEELMRRLKQMSFDEKLIKKYLDKWYVGTDVVAGVECNVYCVDIGAEDFVLWVDPKTALTLRWESSGQYFEVTKFRIDGFDLEKL